MVVLIFTLALAGCGGGGGSTPPITNPDNPTTHHGAWILNLNTIRDKPYTYTANPQYHLPKNNQYGLQVRSSQPHFRIGYRFTDSLRDRLEPSWRYNNEADRRLNRMYWLGWQATHQAYMQWTRHLDYDPGYLKVQIGESDDLSCSSDAAGCFDGDTVILMNDQIERWYKWLKVGLDRRDDDYIVGVYAGLLGLLTHEAGHQFDYHNHEGETEGCGGVDDNYCHAPDGSGSVMSYDYDQRYGVTQDDVHHIPNATYDNDGTDLYTIWKNGEPSSISRWGVWIENLFEVSGTKGSYINEPTISIEDIISGTGWVQGTPSENVSLTTSASWSGEDNFLGVDLASDHLGYLGMLLRADANLNYTFHNQNMNLQVNDFEVHIAPRSNSTASWRELPDRGEFSYDMSCTITGCSNESVETKWYSSDAGDPSGWIAGVVNDYENDYVGSFTAEKD